VTGFVRQMKAWVMGLGMALLWSPAYPANGVGPSGQGGHGGLPWAPGATLEAHTGGITSYRLRNGFKVILVPYPTASSARVELLVKSGSKLEGYGESGMAHLLEHMLYKGAGRRASVKADLEALGAIWNGSTSVDRTAYHAIVAADPVKVDALIDLEADRLIRPRFSAQDLASEMTVVRNELENSEQDPLRLVLRALQRNSFQWHGYARPVIGARSDIENAPFSALKAFHRRHYRPDRAALIVSGRFDAQRVLDRAVKRFGPARNPAQPLPADWTREGGVPATQRSEYALSSGTTLVASAWRLPGVGSREVHAYDLAATAICDADWGSLRRELVLERQLAVSASCQVLPEVDYGRLLALARAGQDADAGAISQALWRHIEQAAVQGISLEQLERARVQQLNLFERIFASHEETAALLTEFEAAGDWRLLFWVRDVVQSVTLDEANAALRTWTVALNRGDVLLRHSDTPAPAALPDPPEPRAMVQGRDWPPFVVPGDPPPRSVGDLSRATRRIDLDGARAQGLLISRKTMGDKAWLVFENDHGSLSSLSGRQMACAVAGQLMAYGGGGLSRDQLSERLEALQATWTLDMQGLTLEAPRRNLSQAFELLLQAWAKPMLPVDELERIRARIVAQNEAVLQDPARLVSSLVRLRFDNYPEGHPQQPRPSARLIDDARAVTREQVEACVRDFVGLARVRLALVGDFTEDDLRGLWAQAASLPRARVAYERVARPEAPDVVDVSPILVQMPDKPNALVLGTAVIPLHSDMPDFAALRLAVEALGGDASSRIWRRLREKEGLAYSAGMSLEDSTPDLRATLQLHATAASGQATAALTSLQAVLAETLAQGFTEAEIRRAREAWRQQRLSTLGLEGEYAAHLAQALLDGHDYAWLERYDAAIARVGAAEATAALRRHLGRAPIVWAIGRGQ
jgi:zinc protease